MDALRENIKAGEELLRQGQSEEALAYIKKALELSPDYAVGHSQIGRYYLSQGKLDEAQRSFSKAIQLDFTLTEAHLNLACLYQAKKECQKALPHFKEVVLANPDNYEIYYQMGICCLAIGMEESLRWAETFFSQALLLKPDFLEPAVDLSQSYLRQKKPSEAEKVLTDILRYHPQVPALHFSLGLILKGQGKYQEAIAHFREVVLKDDQNAHAFNNLGECCYILGMEEQAEPFFAQAVKLEPEFVEAIFSLGKLYYDQGKVDNAILAFEECLRVNAEAAKTKEKWGEERERGGEGARGRGGESPCLRVSASPPRVAPGAGVSVPSCVPIYNFLGRCNVQKGDNDKAREMWEKSLGIEPDQSEITEVLHQLRQPMPSDPRVRGGAKGLHKRVSLTIED